MLYLLGILGIWGRGVGEGGSGWGSGVGGAG